jgi:predicted O-methyltransferase YrrM
LSDVEPDRSVEPARVRALRDAAARSGFTMSSNAETGRLLSWLAAKRLGGQILELGTGFGIGTAWLLEGMDATSRLVTIEIDPDLSAQARRAVGDDRVTFVTANAGEWLMGYDGPPFDVIFADTWIGKFTHLETTLALVALGGTYLIDDLNPLYGWPPHHRTVVENLIAGLRSRADFHTEVSDRSTGLLMATRTVDARAD